MFSFDRNVLTGDELPAPTGSCAHVRNGDTDISVRGLCIELIQGACLPSYARIFLCYYWIA